MSLPPEPDTLTPAPAHSSWGRRAAAIYLTLVALAFVLLFYELASGRRGLGSVALSVLTAPWSAGLALVAQALAPHLPAGVLRALGFLLAAAAALLNARILYGVAARAERDARGAR
ncbi:MAG: hypothetical protein IT347_02670 [Candidatus Eisenbacteria bacterium]|nr:hypothetical protein [Candidatus Eisenbacteria bacterium]